MYKLDMHMWSIVGSSMKLKRTRFPGPDVGDIMNAANDRQFFKD